MLSTLEGKTIIITGATGFIGSNLARKMVAHGAKVYPVIRPSSDLWRVSDLINRLDYLPINLLNTDQVMHQFKLIRPDYVFNFAEPKGHPKDLKTYQTHADTSARLLNNILNACRHISIKKMIHACSSLVYNDPSGKFKEEENLSANNNRGLIKLKERDICWFYAKNNNVPINLLRIFRAYGPWEQPERLILTAIRSIFENLSLSLMDEEHKRDYIFIDDIIGLLEKLAVSELPNGMVINAGSGYAVSAQQVIQQLELILNKKAIISQNPFPQKAGDRGNFYADISRAKSYLEWMPTTSLYDGLSETVDWYKSKKNIISYVPA